MPFVDWTGGDGAWRSSWRLLRAARSRHAPGWPIPRGRRRPPPSSTRRSCRRADAAAAMPRPAACARAVMASITRAAATGSAIRTVRSGPRSSGSTAPSGVAGRIARSCPSRTSAKAPRRCHRDHRFRAARRSRDGRPRIRPRRRPSRRMRMPPPTRRVFRRKSPHHDDRSNRAETRIRPCPPMPREDCSRSSCRRPCAGTTASKPIGPVRCPSIGRPAGRGGARSRRGRTCPCPARTPCLRNRHRAQS